MSEISFVHSPIGILEIHATMESISKIKFISNFNVHKMNNPKEISDIAHQTSIEINEYFNGDRKVFTVPFKLNLPPFYKRVLLEVRKIGYGSKASYGEIAKRVGNIKAARAVGTANSRNPLPLIIPCHRIISSTGGLGGYSGGIDKKSFLLDHESQTFSLKEHLPIKSKVN